MTVTPINTSYKVPVPTTVSEWCWSISKGFRCPREIVHLVEKTKVENVTRILNRTHCCPGYNETGGQCRPVCDPPCSNGICTAPSLCSCDSGYSGTQCKEKGCPEGRWGEGCKMKCLCENGGKCNSADGVCYCPAGYNGTRCQEKCIKGTYGNNCTGTCNCPVGFDCHHINGDCVKCANDTYGDKCENACECHGQGTALCSHVDGRCFCEANWFGPKCELNCPFGYHNGNCIQHMENLSCSCPNELFLCDPSLGCICPIGKNCGIEQKHQDTISAGAIQQTKSSTGLIIGIAVFLFLAITFSCLVVVYYRKRLKVMKKDLANRTGHQNPGLDDDNIFTPEPLTPISQLHIPEFPSVENNQISFSRPSIDMANNPLYIVNYSKPEKNVNIAREKQNNATNEDMDDGYQVPADLKSNLNSLLQKGNREPDPEDNYDHIGPKCRKT